MSTLNKAGLEDVVVSTSDICFIDGREGRLVYRGYDVDDLAAQSTFEEVVYLLLHGEGLIKLVSIPAFPMFFLFSAFEILIAFLQAYVFAILTCACCCCGEQASGSRAVSS